jgi:hypothetical protein
VKIVDEGGRSVKMAVGETKIGCLFGRYFTGQRNFLQKIQNVNESLEVYWHIIGAGSL